MLPRGAELCGLNPGVAKVAPAVLGATGANPAATAAKGALPAATATAKPLAPGQALPPVPGKP